MKIKSMGIDVSGKKNSSWHFWVGFFCLLALYLRFPSREFVTDGVIYATSARSGSELFHPHHLLYNFCAHHVYNIFSKFGSFDAFMLMTAFGGFFTAGSAFLIGKIIRALTGRTEIAVFYMVLYGVFYANFFMGTNAEVNPVNIFIDLCALFLFVRVSVPSVLVALALGILSGTAMLFHQTAIFFSLGLAFLLWSSRWPMLIQAVCALVTALTAGIPYIFAATRTDALSPQSLIKFLTTYVHTSQYESGEWGHGLRLGAVPDAVNGILGTIVAPNLSGFLWVARPRIMGVVALIAAVVFVFGLILLAVRFRKATRTKIQNSPLENALLIWFVTHSAFTLWWNSWNPEFWLGALAPLMILLANSQTRIIENLHFILPRWLMILLTSSLAIANLFGRVIPDSRLEDSVVGRVVTQIGCPRISNGDLILGPTWEIVSYSGYLCGVSLAHNSFFNWPNRPSGQRNAAMNRYRSWIEQTRKNRQIYIMEEELYPEVTGAAGWTGPESRSLYEPFLSSAFVVGTYSRLGREWRIFRL